MNVHAFIAHTLTHSHALPPSIYTLGAELLIQFSKNPQISFGQIELEMVGVFDMDRND